MTIQIEGITNAISRLVAALVQTPGEDRSPKLETMIEVLKTRRAELVARLKAHMN